MSRFKLRPIFLKGAGGRIFALLYLPKVAKRGVLFVPPFAEELNKCRRQITQTARSLADEGCAVLVVDLFGTGDSESDFSKARWEIWKSDVTTAISWMESDGPAVDAIVATRLGCALAAESLREASRSVLNTVFWQPVVSGRQFMTQFLRLQVAASMMESDTQITVETLRAKLEAGSSIEVAGYKLTPELWRSVEEVDLLSSLNRGLGELHIVEVGRMRKDGLSIQGQRLMAVAQEQGIRVKGQRVPGDPIWAATEIVTNSLLEEATVAHLAQRIL